MSCKRFVWYCLAILLFFIGVNYFIWTSYTEVLLTRKKYHGGDLVRMGYILASKSYRKIVNDLPVKHIGLKEFRGQRIDVLTVGDSFSMGGGEGKNSYYQDWIASLNNFTVLNVPPYPTGDLISGFNQFSTLSTLYNSGYLDRIKPRYILIESVERYCVQRFTKPFDLSKTDSIENISNYYKTKTYSDDYLPKLAFINNGNFKYLYYNFLYRFTDHPNRKVYLRDINRPLFSVANHSKLVFYNEDIKHINKATSDNIKKINDNLNALSELLDKKGIKLYFMPIVDKYDLYSDYIVNNPYPRSVFFEELRKLPKNYGFVDTKAILLEEVKKGEKDVYHADDSHWNWKASKKVFETVKFE